MPNHKSAKKRSRQTLKRNEINSQVLSKLKTLLPNKKLHLPIALNDKMLPLKLNEALGYEVATPTVITNLDDKNFKEKIALSIKSYQKIYDSKNEKIVIKPINSAQSLGVFAIKFSRASKSLLFIESIIFLLKNSNFSINNFEDSLSFFRKEQKIFWLASSGKDCLSKLKI